MEYTTRNSAIQPIDFKKEKEKKEEEGNKTWNDEKKSPVFRLTLQNIFKKASLTSSNIYI